MPKKVLLEYKGDGSAWVMPYGTPAGPFEVDADEAKGLVASGLYRRVGPKADAKLVKELTKEGD